MPYRIEQVINSMQRGNEVVCSLPHGMTEAQARDALKDWRDTHNGGAAYQLVEAKVIEEVR